MKEFFSGIGFCLLVLIAGILIVPWLIHFFIRYNVWVDAVFR